MKERKWGFSADAQIPQEFASWRNHGRARFRARGFLTMAAVPTVLPLNVDFTAYQVLLLVKVRSSSS